MAGGPSRIGKDAAAAASCIAERRGPLPATRRRLPVLTPTAGRVPLDPRPARPTTLSDGARPARAMISAVDGRTGRVERRRRLRGEREQARRPLALDHDLPARVERLVRADALRARGAAVRAMWRRPPGGMRARAGFGGGGGGADRPTLAHRATAGCATAARRRAPRGAPRLSASAHHFYTSDLDLGNLDEAATVMAHHVTKKREMQKHAAELVERNLVMLYLDRFQMGVGGIHSWGAKPLWEHLFTGDRSYDFSFVHARLLARPRRRQTSTRWPRCRRGGRPRRHVLPDL